MKKEYKIEGTFLEDEDPNSQSMSIEWIVNGVKSPLPPRLVRWIAREKIEEMLYKD